MNAEAFTFEELWVHDEDVCAHEETGYVTFYFSTDVETLKALTDAVDAELLYSADSATLAIECPDPCPQPIAENVFVQISPTVKGSDVDWVDVDFPDKDLLEVLVTIGFKNAWKDTLNDSSDKEL